MDLTVGIQPKSPLNISLMNECIAPGQWGDHGGFQQGGHTMEMVHWHGHSVGTVKWRDEEEGSRETSQEAVVVVPSGEHEDRAEP